MQYAVFGEREYFFYFAMHSIFLGSILFILSDTQYFRGSILFLLPNTQLFHELGTAYTQFYAEMSGVDTAYTTKYAAF